MNSLKVNLVFNAQQDSAERQLNIQTESTRMNNDYDKNDQ